MRRLTGRYFLVGRGRRSPVHERICDVEITDDLYTIENDWEDVIQSHPIKADRHGIYHAVLRA